MSKLRILCLHGFTSNGAVHKHQVRQITGQFHSDFEFIFPDGPHEVNIEKSYPQNDAVNRAWKEYVATNSSSGHRAWWFAKEPNPTTDDPGGFRGLEKSLEHIGKLMEKSGPIHAIWGFSQGGCFAGFLIALLHEKNRTHPLRKYLSVDQGMPKAGVFFSAFKPRYPQYDGVYEYGIQVPTLHVMGAKDRVVTVERTETLKSVCSDARGLIHSGGHDIPDGDECMLEIVRFLNLTLKSRPSPKPLFESKERENL